MGFGQIATHTVTSAVGTVTLTGIDSDDTYMISYTNIQGSINDKYLYLRCQESGSDNTGNNYNYAGRKLKTYSAFQHAYGYNQSVARLTDEKIGDQDQETSNGIIYIYNANNSSEFTYWTTENVTRDGGGNLMSQTGGGAFRVASAVDGFTFFMQDGNIVSGTLTLYKVT